MDLNFPVRLLWLLHYEQNKTLFCDQYVTVFLLSDESLEYFMCTKVEYNDGEMCSFLMCWIPEKPWKVPFSFAIRTKIYSQWNYFLWYFGCLLWKIFFTHKRKVRMDINLPFFLGTYINLYSITKGKSKHYIPSFFGMWSVIIVLTLFIRFKMFRLSLE